MALIRNYKEGKLTTADIRTLNNTIISLMVLIAATSIAWSISIHILSGDFYNGFIGAKLAFRERDFTVMDNKTKLVFFNDLEKIFNQNYETIANTNNMPIEQSTETVVRPTTKEPKKPKLAHLIQISSQEHNVPDLEADIDDLDDVAENVTLATKVPFDVAADRQYLATMSIDMGQTYWIQSAAVQFVYSFSFMSEIIAIIWAAMCMVFQSGVKKYWGLPKPWRIVVPSILMFSVMAVGNVVYTILANQYLKNFCKDLREHLTNPAAISCGQAFTLLRPIIKQHTLPHDVYLNLFRVSYTFTLVLWLFALMVMVLRYIFAIDFQIVEIETPKHFDEFIEVPLDSPKRQANLLRVSEGHKSEDDFQSAKSHISEAVTPLLEPKNHEPA